MTTTTKKKLVPLPPKVKLSQRDRQQAELIIESTGETPRRALPTGQEDVRLLADVISFAERERRRAARARRADRKHSRFDMRKWASGRIFRDPKTGALPEPSCGTSACIAGTAAAFTLPADQVISNDHIYDIIGWNEFGIPQSGAFRSAVMDRGVEALGFNVHQRNALFFLLPTTIRGGHTAPGIDDKYKSDEGNLDAIKLVATYITGRDFRKVGASWGA